MLKNIVNHLLHLYSENIFIVIDQIYSLQVQVHLPKIIPDIILDSLDSLHKVYLSVSSVILKSLTNQITSQFLYEPSKIFI